MPGINSMDFTSLTKVVELLEDVKGEDEEREVQRAGGGTRGVAERESVTCVMVATLLLGSTIFKERS